jgi:ATP-binding cassette, subfamily B, bacterial
MWISRSSIERICTRKCQSCFKIIVSRPSVLSNLTKEKFVPLRVSENIATGDIEHYNDERIHRAAMDGGADAFIQQLPLKYNTKLRYGSHGPLFRRPRVMDGPFLRRSPSNKDKDDSERSADLSGGQWQRLALSRAFMRASTADLLVLDEPSSSLDPEAEHNLFRFIQQVRRNKTTIYVTHRFYTVRMATKIAFLEEGRLIEWGGHNELMKIEGGKYAKLFQLQSEGFSALGQAEGE